MEELLQNANLGSTERALIIIAGIIVIVLVLVIMYMIDNLPDNYKMKKKHNIKSKDNEDNEDEEVEDNDDYKKKNPFEYLYGNGNFYSFVYDAIDAGKTSNYYRFGTESSTIKTNLENIVTTDSASGSFSANFQTPMIVEFNLTETNKSQYIIANVFYKTVGDDVYERSEFLVDMWKRKGVFSDNGKE